MTLFLPRLDVEQLQEQTLFFLAEDPSTDGSVLDLIVKYFLTSDALIEKIVRHPHVEQTTLNYVRLFGSPATLTLPVSESASEQEVEQKRVLIVSQLRVPEKIRLALKGNREARTLLLKDSNREVVMSVLKSPKLTDDEVEAIAQSKAVSEEVLRVVARNPSWTRRYSVVESLVNNPKTPLAVSLGFLKNLRGNGLDQVAKNKGVPSPLRTTAMKMLQTKRSAGKA